MALTKTAANYILQMLSGKLSSSPYTQVYVGLSQTQPASDGTNVTEPSGANYSRRLLGNASTPATQKMGTAADGQISNNNSSNEYGGKIYFNELGVSETWGTISYVCLFSAATGGHLIAYAELDSPITPTAGTNPVIPVNSLVMSIS